MTTSALLLEKLQLQLADNGLIKTETVQALWSGYGEIARYFSPKAGNSFIVKSICPPTQLAHPRGWNTTASHDRKLMSYQVESCFYQRYQAQCNQSCRVPNLVTTLDVEENQVMVLEDLDAAKFSVRKSQVGLKDVAKGVKWLAHFHARFMQTNAEGLWPVGSYWHLATRNDEFDKMQVGELKDKAQKIDSVLNQSSFQTLVHGDAKLANFCFPDDESVENLAAVDFQYVGRGVGVKDLAYFLGGCLNSAAMFDYESEILKLYFNELKKACVRYHIAVDGNEVEAQWRNLYSLAWADFHRFLLGWAAEHLKINAYMQHQTKTALLMIN
ncbi:oxidoreductase family protein [uncultured Paraglaciecola sp.]|uniref:oxidoreductase family protein n=1 Tax=uncultured Paraglaciecola sp. TaxID=1765024 RepID=UPI0025959F2F|nr:oxidoreductase family protein [uncultured Paraglaciecola sp.]